MGRYEKHAMEYIGLKVEVIKSPSKNRIGIKGKVIDETKNLFIIEKKDGSVVKVPKENTVFRFKDDKTFEIDGSKILYRPEERPKKVR